MSSPRPVLLSEVSFSAPSTNTSFPADEPLDFRTPAPGMHREELHSNGDEADIAAELAAEAYMSPQSRLPKVVEAAFDMGRSPSPEPCRNYSDVDVMSQASSLRSMSTATSAPPAAPSEASSRSDRIQAMHQRIQYVQSQHVPVMHGKITSQYSRREKSQAAAPTGLQMPTGPQAPIPRAASLASGAGEVPRVNQNGGSNRAESVTSSQRYSQRQFAAEVKEEAEDEKFLEVINNSLDELCELLPTLDEHHGATPASTRRQRGRIHELCAKLDNLASAAHEVREAAANRKIKSSRSINHLLEEITRKADSIAYLIESLETPPASRTGSQVSSRRLGDVSMQSQLSNKTRESQRSSTARRQPQQPASAQFRQMLQSEHTETVMDTLEMVTNAICGLADRVDVHHTCLELVIEAQKEQLEAAEADEEAAAMAMGSVEIADEFNPREVEYEEVTEVSASEDGYAESSRTSNTSHRGGFYTADRYSESAVNTSRRTATSATVSNGYAAEGQDGHFSVARSAPSFQHHSVNSSTELATSVSASRRGPHRRIQTPATAAAPAATTTTESLLRTSRREDRDSSRYVSPPTSRAQQLSAVKADEFDRVSSAPSADVSRSLFVDAVPEERDVSRSLFVDEDDASSRRSTRSSRSTSTFSQASTRTPNLNRDLFHTATKHVDPAYSLQDIVGKDKLRTHAERQDGSVSKFPLKAKGDQLGKMYQQLKAENVSLKEQLQSAVDQKDQWRNLVEEHHTGIYA